MSENEKLEEYARTGNLKLLGEIYVVYMHLVFGVSLKYFKNVPDAEDAVSLIFEKLIKDLRKHKVTNFKSWLFVTTQNFCLMELRKGTKMTNTSIEDMEYKLTQHPTEEQHVEDNLEECLEKLPAEQKECIKLFYLEKKSYKQINEQLNKDLNKVKSAIQNEKGNLKICLQSKRENI